MYYDTAPFLWTTLLIWGSQLRGNIVVSQRYYVTQPLKYNSVTFNKQCAGEISFFSNFSWCYRFFEKLPCIAGV